MPTILILALAFFGIFIVVAVVLVVGSGQLKQRNKRPQPVPDYLTDNSTILKLDRLSTISIWEELLARFDFIEGMKKRMAEADLTLTVGRLTAMILLCGAVALALTQNVTWIPGWAAIGSACACGFAPYAWVLQRRNKRFARLQEQLPDALDSLSRALRAGHPLIAGIGMLASEEPAPLGAEMRRLYDERRLGLSWDQALNNLSVRVPLLEMSTFIAAVQLQSRTGGKLSEVLARLSENMREAEALRGEVKAIAAHGRMTGYILTVLPVLITVMLILVSPGYLDILVRHPNGKHLIWAAACSLIAAHFVIRKMVDIRL